jgi:hypothetical protein
MRASAETPLPPKTIKSGPTFSATVPDLKKLIHRRAIAPRLIFPQSVLVLVIVLDQ